MFRVTGVPPPVVCIYILCDDNLSIKRDSLVSKRYKIAIFICRCQPPHLGHVHVITEGLKIADRVLILLGSAFKPADIKNPWTWQERSDMIFGCFPPEVHHRISTTWLEDIVYNDPKWVLSVQQTVGGYNIPDKKICIIGHHKDESSYYLDMFPQWDLVDVGNHEMYNSTDIRNAFFGVNVHHSDHEDGMNHLKREYNKVHPTVIDCLERFTKTKEYSNLVDETHFYKKHADMWKDSPYTPIFVTADAVVFQAGHVLLIRRKNAPGQNTLALPGGYINPDEAVYDSAIRELREETRLKIPTPVLKGSRFDSHVFDHPRRSLRGRIITHAFAFNLEQLAANGQLQEIRGGDDAAEAMWVPLYKLQTPEYKSQMFEDHGEIIQYFVDRMKREWK